MYILFYSVKIYQVLLQLILMEKKNEQSIVLVKNIDHTIVMLF